ncbi:peptidyl-prolyl cis-trans isomerase FKBP16-1, chloroplastic-like isoform X3 [Nicotiana tomentosiformis]|uniref:peptidyl-prolyl cis-trans isomerase FKBP16-1, chloroplastic-like isoform X3 n=1 Tax=Nicotiana tomentosiformis TaxID=4098 RepID=UPI00388C3D11
MEVPQFQASLQFRRFLASQSPCFKDIEHCKIAAPKSSDERVPSLNVKKLLRRSVLQLVGLSPIFISTRPVLSVPVQEMKEPDVIRTLKLASGVRIQDVVEGEGPEAHEGDSVEINYVCRRSNGYFVHSTVDQFSGESAPVILPLDDTQFGPRRSLMSHVKEPLIFEVQLLKVL